MKGRRVIDSQDWAQKKFVAISAICYVEERTASIKKQKQRKLKYKRWM